MSLVLFQQSFVVFLSSIRLSTSTIVVVFPGVAVVRGFAYCSFVFDARFHRERFFFLPVSRLSISPFASGVLSLTADKKRATMATGYAKLNVSWSFSQKMVMTTTTPLASVWGGAEAAAKLEEICIATIRQCSTPLCLLFRLLARSQHQSNTAPPVWAR